MKKLLLDHFRRYPLMEAVDFIKLIFQSEFAGGHMIASPSQSLQRLKDELEALPAQSVRPAAFEYIGGGFCRLHLAELGTLGIAPETVNRLFVGTSRTAAGTEAGYRAKLLCLRQCCKDGALPFSPAVIDGYISRPAKALSHSDAYRTAYGPAYRVVKAACGSYIEVFKRIDALLAGRPRVTVAIDGPSASGKSSLAALLSGMYDCNVFHMDDFFLPPERKTARRLAEPGGNIDHERFAAEVLAGLQSGTPFSYRPYSCVKNALAQPVHVSPKALTIVEGVYSLHPALRMHYDLAVFLQTDSATQTARIRARNGSEMLRRFLSEWIPLENLYFETLRIREQCDIVYPQSRLRVFGLDESPTACI